MGGWTALSGDSFGFLYDGTNYTTFVRPPLVGIGGQASGIYEIDEGRLVGYYYEGLRLHGFAFDGTTFTTVDAPDAGTSPYQGTSVFDAEGDVLVGDYYDSDWVLHAILFMASSLLKSIIPKRAVMSIKELQSLASTGQPRRVLHR